jgi:hypothetical protein
MWLSNLFLVWRRRFRVLMHRIETTCPLWLTVLGGNAVVGMNLTFLFDFGDNWEFSLVVEAIDTGTVSLAKPKLLKQEGKAPKQYHDYSDW